MSYYHGSRKLFEAGFKLAPQPDGYVHFDETVEFEALVESRRPHAKLSRAKAVFMSMDKDLIDGAGGYIDAIYAVEPGKTVEESDLRWYSEAWCLWGNEESEADKKAIEKFIDNYWSGLPFPHQRQRNPEYRTESALVIRLDELNVELDELERVKGLSGRKDVLIMEEPGP